MQDPLSNPNPGSQAFFGGNELDLKVYARIVLQWAWLIILCTIAAAATAYVISDLSVPIYQASATLLVNEGRTAAVNYQDMVTSERAARTYAELIVRASTLAKVANQLGVQPDVLSAALTSVTATPVRDTQLMKVTIEGTSPDVVAAVANALPIVFGEELKAVQEVRYADAKSNLQDRIQDLSTQINQTQVEVDRVSNSIGGGENVEVNRLRGLLSQLQDNYNSSLQSLETLNLTAAQSSDSISVVEMANVPSTAIRPRKLNNTLLAAIVGAMIALGVIFLIEYLDDRVRAPQDLERIVETSILSTISLMPGQTNQRWRMKKEKRENLPLITLTEPRHPIAESYRSLRSNLHFASIDIELNSLLVTSATESEGKTTTAANLAVVMAQAGKRVILVDTDLRKPRINRIFQFPNSPGLTDALFMEDDSPALYLRDTDTKNLRVMTSGKIPPNPADLLGSQRMQRLVESMKKEADVIIFDAPPLLAVTDAAILSQLTQGVVLVVDTSKTSRASVARGVDVLAQAGANLFGVVLNRLVRNARSYGYYYYDSYGKYYGDEIDPSDPPTPPSGNRPDPTREKHMINGATLVPGLSTNGYTDLQSQRAK